MGTPEVDLVAGLGEEFVFSLDDFPCFPKMLPLLQIISILQPTLLILKLSHLLCFVYFGVAGRAKINPSIAFLPPIIFQFLLVLFDIIRYVQGLRILF